MHRITRFRPTPAMVVASIALLVALGGTGVAAVSKLAPVNSVGTAQVVDHSLLAKDLRAGVIPSQGALAYAHVNKDGTLDATLSKNVAVVPATSPATSTEANVCLKVTAKQAPKSAVATLDLSASAGKQIGVIVGRDLSTSCQGPADALVATTALLQTTPKNAFYIVFN